MGFDPVSYAMGAKSGGGGGGSGGGGTFRVTVTSTGSYPNITYTNPSASVEEIYAAYISGRLPFLQIIAEYEGQTYFNDTPYYLSGCEYLNGDGYAGFHILHGNISPKWFTIYPDGEVTHGDGD